MVTLKDVAERADVSVSLVSYVLNGKKKVRPETYQRILDAVEELDYYPNLAASGLKTNLSKMIGVVVSDMMDPFFTELLSCLEKDLLAHGYCMIVCNSENNARTEKKCIRNLLSRRIDGLILIGIGENDYDFLSEQELPVVSVDRKSGEGIPTIKTENSRGGQIGAKYLHQKGYHIQSFLSVSGKRYAADRAKGFMEYAERNALSARVIDLEKITYEQTLNAVRHILEENGKEKQVIFCATDAIAALVLRALSQQGILVPDTVAVLGFGNSSMCEYTNPPLTTVAQDKREISQKAVSYIFRMLDGEKKIANYYLDSKILERGSVL